MFRPAISRNAPRYYSNGLDKVSLKKAMGVSAGFLVCFSFGWGAVNLATSELISTPWAWYWLLNKPTEAIITGAVFGVAGAAFAAAFGFRRLAPLTIALPVAWPNAVDGLFFHRIYHAVAVDFGWLLLALATAGFTAAFIPSRWKESFRSWKNTNKARKSYGILIPAAFFSVSLIVFTAGDGFKTTRGFTGDSPQYLLITSALFFDHTPNLMPAIIRDDRRLWYPHNPIGGHGKTYKNTEHYSKYKSGYPAILTPGFGAGWWAHYSPRIGAVMEMILLGALVAWQLYSLLLDFKVNPSSAALGAVGVMFTFPMIIYSSQIFPEMAAALLVVVSLRIVIRGDNARSWHPVALGGVIGALMLFHERFFFFCGPVALAYFWLTRRRAAGVWTVFIITLAAFAGLNAWDSISRHFPVIPDSSQHGRGGAYWNKNGVWVGWIGGFFDKSHGLLPYAPAFFMAPAYIVSAVRNRTASQTGVLGLALFVYLALYSYEEWWGGFCPPGGRYYVSYYPLLAIPAAVFWDKPRAGWVYWTFFTLLATSIVIPFLYVTDGFGIHTYFLEHKFSALETSRIYSEAVLEGFDWMNTAIWTVVLAIFNILVLYGHSRETSFIKFGAYLMAALFTAISVFYAFSDEADASWSARQTSSFGVSQGEGRRLIWSAITSGQLRAIIPAKDLPRVDFIKLGNGWVKVAPGAKAAGFVIFGKYMKLPPGEYTARIPMRVQGGDGTETGFVDVIDHKESKVLIPKTEFNLSDGVKVLFKLEKPMLNVEVRFTHDSGKALEIGPMTIEGERR